MDDARFQLISKALADPKRFEILQKLGTAKDAPTCSCVRDWVGLSAATISHHLKELEAAGLIELERHGKFAYIRLRRDVLRAYGKRLAEL